MCVLVFLVDVEKGSDDQVREVPSPMAAVASRPPSRLLEFVIQVIVLASVLQGLEDDVQQHWNTDIPYAQKLGFDSRLNLCPPSSSASISA